MMRVPGPSSCPPSSNVTSPLMIAATILMNELEAESIGIPSEFGKLGFDLCLGLGRLGLRPTREQKSVSDAL